MNAFILRAGRRSLARTIFAVAAASVLGACADETTAPALNTPSRAAANAAAPSPEPYTTSVDLVVERVADSPAYGTTVRLGIACSTTQVVDIIVDLEQQVKSGNGKQLVQGSGIWPAYRCEQANPSVIIEVIPADPSFDFQLGRAKLRARIANYQPGVEPADVTTRVRIVADGS